MSQAVITKAFSEWKAQQAIDNKPVILDEFIFAYIPGLDTDKPIDNTETTPAADKIVHRQAVSKSGVVNEHSVVYSVTMGADVGDFDFNWIGLANKATGTLAMIIHAPTQRKVKNANGQQGNVLVRSMLMEYSGARAATEISTPAETWQIDFTARLAAMDERQRRENIDLYGAAAFFDSGYLVAKSGNQYFVTKGAGYVAGLRSELLANQNITVSAKPTKVWLDVCWTGTLTSEWAVQSKITVAANLADYVQSGVQHYVFAVANIDAAGNITDLRPKGTLDDQTASNALKEHEKSRNHPDATTSEKGFVKLSNATNSDSETLAATPKAVKAANDNANTRTPSTRKVNGYALSSDVVLSADDVDAIPVEIVGVINDNKTIASANKTGWWRVAVSNTATISDFPTFPGGVKLYGYGYLFVDLSSGSWLQHYYSHRGQNAKRQGWDGPLPTPGTSWVIEYNTANKPTPEDIGALPISGGQLTGGLGLHRGILFFPESAYKNKAEGLTGTYATDALDYRWELYARSKANSSIRSNIFTVDITDISKGSTASGGGSNNTTTITVHGRIVTPFQIQPGDWTNFDARYQAKGNYTPAGQAYTKAESDARFVRDVRLGAQVMVSPSNNGGKASLTAPAGHMLTAILDNDTPRFPQPDTPDAAYARPVQKFLNNQWVTVSQL
ncbi:TPA: phage tail protein [Citrobacter koseri]|nr:phage tail protein [Citrobacter koseri]